MRRSLTARTLVVCAVLAVVLAAGFALLVIAISSLRDAGEAALRAQRAITTGTELERSVLTLETGLRGFVATGRDRELRGFREARADYPAQVGELRDLMSGDPALRADVAVVEEQIEDYLGLWALPLLDTARERPAYARALLGYDRGRERVTEVQTTFERMFDRAQATAAAKERRADRRSDVATASGVLGILLVVVAAAGATVLLRRGVLMPIGRVARASETVAGGDFTARVPDDRADELGDLARSFNAMAAALAARTTALERSNRELEDYASVTAHDLQGPLVTMSMYAGLLAQRLDGEDRKLAEHIRDGTASMRRLVRDLLGYARLERLPGRQERVELDTVLRRALDSLAGPLQDAGAQVTTGPLPAVVGDADRLQQLLQNLLTNAIKFTEEGVPQIEVSCDAGGIVTVRDNGIGFQPGQAEVIFRPFQRLHSADRFEGSGIGLAVCQKIIEQHGGRIWAEGEPGEGASFHVELPIAERQDAPASTLVGAGGLPT